VHPERPSELARAVRHVLDSESASRLGEAAQHTAATRFTLDRMVKETVSLYDCLRKGHYLVTPAVHLGAL